MIKQVAQIIFIVGVAIFLSKRALRYLRYLQQDGYEVERFFSWIGANKAVDTRGILVLIAAFFVSYFLSDKSIIYILEGLIFLILGLVEPDPRKEGKKKLVFTKRAKAIFLTSTFVMIGLVLVLAYFDLLPNIFIFLALMQTPPLLLALSVLLLTPREKALQAKFLKEAHDKIQKLDPYVIGVTGSFGKSSVKNLLGQMMNLCLGPTFWPREGVNTPMGITREIRERLEDFHKYAVIEMGAYREGSIKRLCDLTPVDAGIVTAVHLMHLERFGSEQQVYNAKSELPQAIPSDGVIVLNGDNSGSRKMASEFKKEKTLIYGLDNTHGDLSVHISGYEFLREGTRFKVEFQGGIYDGFTKMHGRGALSNIAACFSMLACLGVHPEIILASLRDIRPVSNRLEVVDCGAFMQINDAYNSNPMGFRYALEVLRDLPGRRKVVVTPGMIELGDKSYEENKEIAKLFKDYCDFVILVNETNKKAYLDGLAEIGYSMEKVKWFMTRDEALSFYKEISAEGDVLLLENDLPDLQEFKEYF